VEEKITQGILLLLSLSDRLTYYVKHNLKIKYNKQVQESHLQSLKTQKLKLL